MLTSLNDFRNLFFEQTKHYKEKGKIYFLRLPTGGGKTLTSLSLALNLQHDGVIYVSPRNSILEQTEKVYQNIFGKENIISHFGLPDFSENINERQIEHIDKLLWNSRYILTSYVQFFESLFVRKVPKSLKLSSLYNRAIIIDEVQLINNDVLNPIISALEYLAKEQSCSIILTTATFPDYSRTILNNNNIVHVGNENDIDAFFEKAKNVHVEYSPENNIKDLIESICNRIDEEQPHSMLYVANTISQAKTIYDYMSVLNSNKYQVYCLTTHNVSPHKRDILNTVECNLENKIPTILISTQIVEAGVDLDFDVGFRELAGLNSIIQTAGRVKRHRREEKGVTHVVEYPKMQTYPTPSNEIQISRKMLMSNNIDLEQYSKRISKRYDYDEKNVIPKMNKFMYETVSKDMKLIDNQTQLFVRDYNQESNNIYNKLMCGQPVSFFKYMKYVISMFHLNDIDYTEVEIPNTDRKINVYTGIYHQKKGILKCT